MFAITPPQNYPTMSTVVPQPVTPGAPQPLTDSNNRLEHPQGPESQLVVGEGTYLLRESWFLSTPSPHPSEPIPSTQQWYTATVQPRTAGTQLSLLNVTGNKAPRLYGSLHKDGKPNWSTYSIAESEKETRVSLETDSSGTASKSDNNTNPSIGKTNAFGSDNGLLAQSTASKDPLKKKKPKTKIEKSSSSYISRIHRGETLKDRNPKRDPDDTFAFANIDRAFQWIDLSLTDNHRPQHLSKILFTKARMLCHNINEVTKSSDHADIVMGSSTADIFWYEPFTERYNRLNKNGVINASPVNNVSWLPGSENIFLASHTDGTLAFYDKEREDAPFVPDNTYVPTLSNWKYLFVSKSVNSKNQKTNPVALWSLTDREIACFAFSPDARHLAVGADDMTLRIIDYLEEKELDIFYSSFGAITCVCWSPDGKLIVTGGEDDQISVWSFLNRQLLARCSGHNSWVTAVAFDPWRCDGKIYRFGSVGLDCKLLLWDFDYNMLQKPKAAGRHRVSISSAAPLTAAHTRTDSSAAAAPNYNPSLSTPAIEAEDSIEHRVESHKDIPKFPAVMSKIVDPDELSWLGFQEDCIMTSCVVGHIRVWDRPKKIVTGSEETLSAASENLEKLDIH